MRLFFFRLWFPLFVAPLVYALPLGNSTSTDKIKWDNCPDELKPHGNYPAKIKCGNLTVPLDYAYPDGDKIELRLLKVLATKKPFMGTILVNMGEPGALARQALLGKYHMLQSATGYHHDLVTFDVRGTGDTLPFRCSRPPKVSSIPVYPNKTFVPISGIWDKATQLANACYEVDQDVGEYIGTVAVARDAMSIVDALPEDKLIRFWGTSHGTVLGATIAAMFPERVDKLLLDGVVDFQGYYRSQMADRTQGEVASLKGFFAGCVAAPQYCPLFKRHMKAADIQRTYDDFLNRLKYEPVVHEERNVTDTMVRHVMALTLPVPAAWSDLSVAIWNLYDGRGGPLLRYYDDRLARALNSTTGEASLGIRCGDSFYRTSNYTDVQAFAAAHHEPGPALEDEMSTYFTCAQWKMSAKERHDGRFHVRTRNSALLVGTSYDPVSPWAAAQSMSESLQRSILIRQNSYGHGLLSQVSLCTLKVIRAYFRDDRVPLGKMQCEPVGTFYDHRGMSHTFDELDASV